MPSAIALAATWLIAGFASPPTPLTLTAEESAQLAQGEVVTRYVEANGKSWNVLVVDVNATSDEILAAVLDLPGKARDLSGFEGVELYDKSPSQIAARWQVESVGFEMTFHTIYKLDAASGWVEYELDRTRDNDLSEATGSYRVYTDHGQTRLEYRDRSVPLMRAPDWLRKRMQMGFLKSELEWIRAAAEGR